MRQDAGIQTQADKKAGLPFMIPANPLCFCKPHRLSVYFWH
ncbi:hypothetical protein NEIELOOT_00448 [Neisseria elongata subsp. glycolytica ATCC 29315]|uniref:Uncharacterized protein n=1 Tax=Neisseria elongata subsp. glycolytica ATCC 29315 TaxID=546263 RepID=D4DN24_NEIEG|nr:hypothetical protein NEIELOOT_00448 [Neisseria elongata subsp. glycolytica ATCC 29315]